MEMKNTLDTLKKQRKKLVACALACGISMSSLTGCYSYGENSYGQEVIKGKVDIDVVKNLKLIRVYNETANYNEYFLARRGKVPFFNEYYYNNIDDGYIVYDPSDDDYKNFKVDVIIDDNMIDYLYRYNMKKDEYSGYDIKVLKSCLLNDPNLGKTIQKKK